MTIPRYSWQFPTALALGLTASILAFWRPEARTSAAAIFVDLELAVVQVIAGLPLAAVVAAGLRDAWPDDAWRRLLGISWIITAIAATAAVDRSFELVVAAQGLGAVAVRILWGLAVVTPWLLLPEKSLPSGGEIDPLRLRSLLAWGVAGVAALLLPLLHFHVWEARLAQQAEQRWGQGRTVAALEVLDRLVAAGSTEHVASALPTLLHRRLQREQRDLIQFVEDAPETDRSNRALALWKLDRLAAVEALLAGKSRSVKETLLLASARQFQGRPAAAADALADLLDDKTRNLPQPHAMAALGELVRSLHRAGRGRAAENRLQAALGDDRFPPEFVHAQLAEHYQEAGLPWRAAEHRALAAPLAAAAREPRWSLPCVPAGAAR